MSEMVQMNDAIILKGEEGEPVSFTLPSGLQIAARTDKGINYKEVNEDRVLIGCTENVQAVVAVIDGMGGQGDGAAGATFLAEALRDRIHTIQPGNVYACLVQIMKEGQEKILKTLGDQKDTYGSSIAKKTGAAVQILVVYTGEHGQVVEGLHSGDVRRIYVPHRGGAPQESNDHLNSAGILTKAISGELLLSDPFSFQTRLGGRVVVTSDGVVPRNVSTAEVVAMSRQLSLEEIVAQIWNITDKKMQSTLLGPQNKIPGSKADNRAFVIMHIPEPAYTKEEEPTNAEDQQLPDFEIDEE